MRDRMYKVDRISKRNFDRAIEDKIRPAKIDMLKEMKLPDIRNTQELSAVRNVLTKGIAKLNGYNWEGKENLREEAVRRLTTYHGALVTYWQMDDTIKKIAKTSNVHMMDAYQVIGPWKVWKNIFDGDKLSEDRGQLLYERWLQLYATQDDWDMTKKSWIKVSNLFNTLATQAGSFDGSAYLEFDTLRKNFIKRKSK